tara:strand:- start:339 stop:926 length:588 start_codon:yes stop_codon:yes gene_type:complete
MNKLIDKKVNKTSAQDCKQTPTELARKLIRLVPIKPDDMLYEPFKGDGNFYNEFPQENPKLWSEIKENVDFFNYDGENVEWVISNPPWSKITKILDKLVKICNCGFALLIHSLTISPNRVNFIEDNGFVITKYHMVKVTGWFSHSVFIVCEKKTENNCSCISFDNTVFQMPENERQEYKKLQKEYQHNYYLNKIK